MYGYFQARPAFLLDDQNQVLLATAPPASEDLELAMAISASIQSALQENLPGLIPNLSSEASTSNSQNIIDLDASIAPTPLPSIEGPSTTGASSKSNEAQLELDAPTTPQIEDNGPIHYPSVNSIDSSPIEISPKAPDKENALLAKGGDKKEEGSSSSCVICLDAPVEGACIPCGHMAGCMSCLSEIKAKKWGCPVCRSKIDQVVRLYVV